MKKKDDIPKCSSMHGSKQPHAVFAHEDFVILSTNIERIRNEQGMDVKKLAQVSGLVRQTIHDIEKLKGDPKLSTIRKIAEALGVSIGDLFTAPQQSRDPRHSRHRL